MPVSITLQTGGVHPDDAQEVFENLVRAFRAIGDGTVPVTGHLDAADDTAEVPPVDPVSLDATAVLDVTDPADPASNPATDA